MTTRHIREANGQSRVTLWHRYSEIAAGDAGNALAFQTDASQLWGHYVQQNPPTLNAQVSQRCQLEAGTWAGQVLYFGNSQSGKLTIYLLSLDTGEQQVIGGEWDTYAAGYNAGNLLSFNVPMTGGYRVQWKCTGRNLSNLTPFYRLYITHTELWRTGA
jgi:hypothetical protein